MRTKSISTTSLAELEALIQHQIHNDFQPNLAIVFSSISFSFEEIEEVFSGKNIDLIGGTTSGEIIDGEVLESSIVCLLMDLDASYYQIRHADYCEGAVFTTAKNLASKGADCFKNPGFIAFSGGATIDGEQVVLGLQAPFEQPVPIFGGMAGDDIAQIATFVFTNGWISSNGLIILIIDLDQVEVKGLATSGWNALGRTHKITKAQGNIIYQIDDQPALDLFFNYFGKMDYTAPSFENAPVLTIHYPLRILNENKKSHLRSILRYETDEKTLILAGGVREGDNFRFCPTPDLGVLQETIQIMRTWSEVLPDPDGLIMVTCKARHTAFGPLMNDEVHGVNEIWGKPMVGFMANGEIGHTIDNPKCLFHNVTCTVILFKEKATA